MTARTPAQHVEILRTEGGRLASMPVELLAAPVPALPDWTLERVVRHTGKIHQWVTGLLDGPPDVDLRGVAAATAGIPHGAECLPAYRAALDDVVTALDGQEPDRPVASFLGVSDVRFWSRRQAQEVTVHRIDAADAVHAAGGPVPDPIDPAGAIDGIDEWLHVFVANRRTAATDDPLRSRTVGIDAGEGIGWTVDFAGDGSGCKLTQEATRTQLDSADVRLSGSPETMLLVCWRRRPLESLDVHGDHELAAAFHDTLRF